MAKQKKSARELAEMVAQKIGTNADAVIVGPDPQLGWFAAVMGAPAAVSALQARTDAAARELRSQYELA